MLWGFRSHAPANPPITTRMSLTAFSSSSLEEPTNRWRRYSDLPPSYEAVEAERRGLLNVKAPSEPPLRAPPEPPASGGTLPTLPTDPLTPNRMVREPEPTPLYLDPSTGEPRVAHMVSDALLAQCIQQGHVEKTKFGTLSIIAAAMFFPWGLLCLIGSRVVYCERCGLVLRAPRGCRVMYKERSHKRGHHH